MTASGVGCVCVWGGGGAEAKEEGCQTVQSANQSPIQSVA